MKKKGQAPPHRIFTHKQNTLFKKLVQKLKKLGFSVIKQQFQMALFSVQIRFLINYEHNLNFQFINFNNLFLLKPEMLSILIIECNDAINFIPYLNTFRENEECCKDEE